MGYETSVVHPWLKREIRKEFPTAYIHKPRAGTYGKKGTSDFICCLNGLFVAIEAKADITKEVTRLQGIELQRVRDASGLSYSIFGKDEIMLWKIFADIHRLTW